MTEVVLTCANHPTRETSLRCKRCDKPICASCAVLTPVGYRCRECVRGQQATFDTAGVGALGVGAVVSAVGTGVALVPLS
ncbi:MAG TPA: B-box zinc finger protein, partial [Anaerolineales bacterium]|nr:B-box zinc finger protein [Anaerolineales bacterium]